MPAVPRRAEVKCDKRGCPAEVSGDYRIDGTTHYGRMATAYGWTFWAARGRRAYCPGTACGWWRRYYRLKARYGPDWANGWYAAPCHCPAPVKPSARRGK